MFRFLNAAQKNNDEKKKKLEIRTNLLQPIFSANKKNRNAQLV